MTFILMTLMTLSLMYKMTLIPKYSYSNISGICEFDEYDIIFETILGIYNTNLLTTTLPASTSLFLYISVASSVNLGPI